MFSRSRGSYGRGRSCCRYHSLLPGAGEIALLLLLLDEGVRTVVLTHDRFADVSDLAALVEFAAQKGELVLRRRLERFDLVCRLLLEKKKSTALLTKHVRRR